MPRTPMERRRPLSDAERRVLDVLVSVAEWVPGGRVTLERSQGYQVGTCVVRRLVERGLAKARAEAPDGRPVRGAALASFDWRMVYTATRAGRKKFSRHGGSDA